VGWILFSRGYPSEEVGKATRWFDNATISEADRFKTGRQNPAWLLRLG
jgi:2,3-dihydroxybenzoate decarboxylase